MTMKKQAFTFGILSACPFLGAGLLFGHEINPLYYIPCFLLLNRRSGLALKIILILPIFSGMLWIYFAEQKDPAIDFAQTIICISSAYCYNRLDRGEAGAFCAAIFYCYLVAIALMIFQKLNLDFLDLCYSLLTIRTDDALHLYNYTGGTIGFAPEPSYMASWIIGYWIILSESFRINKLALDLITISSLLLTASLSGATIFLVIFFVLGGINKNKIIVFLALLCIGALSLHVSRSVDILANRIEGLYDIVISGAGFSLLEDIDVAFGSSRLRTLVLPLTSISYCGYIICGQSYVNSYSLFSNIYYLASPIHLFLILFLLRGNWYSRRFLVSIFLSIFYAPQLNWLLVSGLFRRRITPR